MDRIIPNVGFNVQNMLADNALLHHQHQQQQQVLRQQPPNSISKPPHSYPIPAQQTFSGLDGPDSAPTNQRFRYDAKLNSQNVVQKLPSGVLPQPPNFALQSRIYPSRKRRLTQLNAPQDLYNRSLQRQQQYSHGVQPSPNVIQQYVYGMQPSSNLVKQSLRNMQPSPHGVQPSPHGVQPTQHGVQPSPHGVQPSPHGVQPPPNGVQPSPHGVQPTQHGVQPPSHGMQPPQHGVKPSQHGVQPPQHGMQPSPNVVQPSPYGMQPPQHGVQPPHHGVQPSPNVVQQSSHGVQPPLHVHLPRNFMQPSPHVTLPSSNVKQQSRIVMRPSPNFIQPSLHGVQPSPNVIQQSPRVVQPSPNVIQQSSHGMQPSVHGMQQLQRKLNLRQHAPQSSHLQHGQNNQQLMHIVPSAQGVSVNRNMMSNPSGQFCNCSNPNCPLKKRPVPQQTIQQAGFPNHPFEHPSQRPGVRASNFQNRQQLNHQQAARGPARLDSRMMMSPMPQPKQQQFKMPCSPPQVNLPNNQQDTKQLLDDGNDDLNRKILRTKQKDRNVQPAIKQPGQNGAQPGASKVVQKSGMPLGPLEVPCKKQRTSLVSERAVKGRSESKEPLTSIDELLQSPDLIDKLAEDVLQQHEGPSGDINSNEKNELQQSISTTKQADELVGILEGKFGGQDRPMTKSQSQNMFTDEDVDQLFNYYSFTTDV